jgi:hypothetical protein
MQTAVAELDVIHTRATWFTPHLQSRFKNVMAYIARASLKKANSLRRDIKDIDNKEKTITNSGAQQEKERSNKITIQLGLARTVKYLQLLLQYYESLCDFGYKYRQLTKQPDLDEKKRMKMLRVVDDAKIKEIIEDHFAHEYSEEENEIIVPVRKRKSKRYD